MAVIKCKMCGGQLKIIENSSVCECEYCGTKQTIPTVKDENIQSLFNRANHLRMKAEFDKASEIYEKIISTNDKEAEAYWGLILCKYGIEYVEDPTTYKRIPTCHRASYEAVVVDEDYKLALQYADMFQKEIYEREAKAIDDIQKGIVQIAQKEEPYDVFICYKETDEDGKRTQDSVIANDIYYQLTQEGYKVFYAAITLEGKLGQEYEPYIFSALNSAKVMLTIGTKTEYFNAVWVKNEWSRFLKILKNDRSRMLIPCYRDMDAYDLPEEFAHLQAQDMSKIGFINDLVRGIKKIVGLEEKAVSESPVVQQTVVAMSGNVEALLKRGNLALEDMEWERADGFFEEVLNHDAENAYAYLGKMLAELKLSSASKISTISHISFTENKDFIKALRFADDKLKEELNGYVKKRMEEEEKRVLNEKRVMDEIEWLLSEKETKKEIDSLVACGDDYSIGLKKDGTVVATGDNDSRKREVETWRDIVAVAFGFRHSIGLKKDGTVVATGDNKYGQCKIETWRDIVAVACGDDHSIGLKKDGTVVATGDNGESQCEVEIWRDIVAVACGGYHSIGLKKDGTVMATGEHVYGQCKVETWRDVVAVACGNAHSIGLKKDGTVVATGYNYNSECEVETWRDIAAVACGRKHSIGLKKSGTVVATGDNKYGQCKIETWRDIVAVACGDDHSIGLKKDGTVVATGNNKYGQCKVETWKLFDNVYSYLEEKDIECKAEEEKRKVEEEKQKFEWRQLGCCQHCGGMLKGFFIKKCVSCCREKDY